MEEEELLPWLFDENSDSFPENKLRFTDKDDVRRVYQIGRVVVKLLSDAGLTFWSSGGTTLGIVRHGGLIPWDDDLDFCILEQVM